MADEKGPQTPAKSSGSGRSRRLIYYLVVLIVIVAVALYFTGHLPGTGGTGGTTTTTAAPPVGSGFLATMPSGVIFIQWNQTTTTATGAAQIAKVEGQPPAEKIVLTTTPVTADISKSNLSVDFKDVTAVFGNTSGSGFILDFPQPDGSLAPVTFKKASAQDYNKALAALRTQVDSANAAAGSTTTSTSAPAGAPTTSTT